MTRGWDVCCSRRVAARFLSAVAKAVAETGGLEELTELNTEKKEAI